jgi:hypothetical protein
LPVPFGSPIRKSLSWPSPKALPSLIHCAWMPSNWREMLALKQTKIRPRSTWSSSAPRRQRRAVGHPAADDAVAEAQQPVEAEGVARVGAADVRAERAAPAVQVLAA